MKKRSALVLLTATLTALGVLTASAQAAPARSGFAYVNLTESEFPVTYPGPDNSDVKTLAFNVYAEHIKPSERVGLLISCSDDSGAVYSGQRTVGYGNQDVVFQVSFYVSTDTAWTGQLADCTANLIYEVYSKRTGFAPPVTLYTTNFQIGASA